MFWIIIHIHYKELSTYLMLLVCLTSLAPTIFFFFFNHISFSSFSLPELLHFLRFIHLSSGWYAHIGSRASPLFVSLLASLSLLEGHSLKHGVAYIDLSAWVRLSCPWPSPTTHLPSALDLASTDFGTSIYRILQPLSSSLYPLYIMAPNNHKTAPSKVFYSQRRVR